ncbi:MAG TPA: ABC transporter permease [Gemmatimonadaceae bacterium]|jgi:ABC-2 type transport system permease protein|nr:ABC transporter permease [Gemmatimonadaceae bacterium]
MAKLWAIIKREYLERVRTRWFIFATIFGPLFFGAMIIIPAVMAKRSRSTMEFSNTRIIDATTTGIGQRVAEAMNRGRAPGAASPHVVLVKPSELSEAESTATREVIAKQISGYLVTDESTLRGEELRYAGRNATSIGDMERVRSTVKDAILAQRLENAGIDSSRVKDMTLIPLKLNPERITDKGRGGSGTVSIIFAGAIAFLLYMTIVLYGQNVLRGVLEEKTTRVAEVVVSSVSPEKLLAGKILGVGAVGLTQQILWVITTVVMFKLRQPILQKFGVSTMPFALPEISIGLALLLLLFFVLGFVFYSSLYAAVGSSVNTEQEAQQAVQPMLILLVATAIFINPILINPTSTLATVMSLLPFSAPIIMPLRLALGSVPWYELVISLVGVFLACLGATWLAARIYRVGLLMYGKRPTLREMGRWISYSR